MLSIHNLEMALPIFRALSSELRVQILNQVHRQEGIYLKELSKMMNIPSSTLAPHIHMLEECGLLRIIPVAVPHGTRKRCYSGGLDQIAIYLDEPSATPYIYHSEIPVGHYSSFHVTPHLRTGHSHYIHRTAG